MAQTYNDFLGGQANVAAGPGPAPADNRTLAQIEADNRAAQAARNQDAAQQTGANNLGSVIQRTNEVSNTMNNRGMSRTGAGGYITPENWEANKDYYTAYDSGDPVSRMAIITGASLIGGPVAGLAAKAGYAAVDAQGNANVQKATLPATGNAGAPGQQQAAQGAAQTGGPNVGVSSPYAWSSDSVFAPMQERLGQAGTNQMAASNAQAQSLFAQQGKPITAPQVTGGAVSYGAPGQAQAPLPTASQANAARGGGPTGIAANPGANAALDQFSANGNLGARPSAYSTVGAAPTGLALAGAGQPASFQTGTQFAAQNNARPQPINTAGLGAVNTNTASQLGAAYQVGGVGNVAGRLGSAPQVGQVGNVSTGSAPQAVTGQLGNLGLNNQNQASFIDRTNQFLDRPDGPSVAESQLQSAQADNMANLIGAARSGRGGAGDQAQALRDAMSAGSGIMSETAGQMATLRANEEDMRRNRELNAIGLGGQMSQAQRGQDLSFRGQDLQALQGDQSTSLGARGQDLNASLANQSTQLGLEQLRGQLGISARGQDLSALQGDQSTALGLQDIGARTAVTQRGQNLSALQGDQGAQLGVRGQNLGASTANLDAALGARGQDVQQQLGLAGVNAQLRGQDLSAFTNDADRQLAAQELGVKRDLGYGGLGLQAQQQGMGYDATMQGLNLQANAMGQGAFQSELDRQNRLALADRGYAAQQLAAGNQPSFWEQIAGQGTGAVMSAAANYGMRSLFDGGGGSSGGGGSDPTAGMSDSELDDYFLSDSVGYTE